jgi:ribosomal protein L29
MKYKEIQKLGNKDREKKLKDLKMELVKEGVSKQGGNKSKKIRKIIARIHTLNTSENKSSDRVENK